MLRVLQFSGPTKFCVLIIFVSLNDNQTRAFQSLEEQASNCKGWALKKLGLLVAETEGWDFCKSSLLPVIVTLTGA